LKKAAIPSLRYTKAAIVRRRNAGSADAFSSTAWPSTVFAAAIAGKTREAIAACNREMGPPQKLQEAAESVRLAQLLVLKAELELIRYSEVAHSERMRKIEYTKRTSSIERKRDYWQSITVEAILIQYAI